MQMMKKILRYCDITILGGKCSLFILCCIVFFTLYAFLPAIALVTAGRFTLSVYADTASSSGNTIQYRSEASVDVAVGNALIAQCGGRNIQNIPPNHNTCNGYYSLNNPVGNFGDPNCEFANNPAKAKSNLYALLRQLDPSYVTIWYMKLIPAESGYNPNAYLGASTSGAGAYGLVQMNPAGHGQYDRGSVYWELQIANGINYNNLVLNPDSMNGGPCGGRDQHGLQNQHCPAGHPTTWCYWPDWETGLTCTKKTVCQ